MPGKFARAFEESLAKLAQNERYAPLPWLQLPPHELHNGYFAVDRKGTLKDTRGNTQADDNAYELIMRDKERLLDLQTPLRFIFSHSALREGWDNPNVFQICTLNESQSGLKKRQEIGRGLRLPVNQQGQRVFDTSLNKLFVMANESYESFARALQVEYEEDCGVTFGKVPLTALAKLPQISAGEEKPLGRPAAQELQYALVAKGWLTAEGRITPAFRPREALFDASLPTPWQDMATEVVDLLTSYQIERHIQRDKEQKPNPLRKEVQLSDEFRALWERIQPKTAYRVSFKTQKLVQAGATAVQRMAEITPPKVVVQRGELSVEKKGVSASLLAVAEDKIGHTGPLPDILAYLQQQTELTRDTLVQILRQSKRLPDFLVNPQQFMDRVAAVLKYELHRLLVDGIKYERIPGAAWEMRLFQSEELVNYLTAVQVRKSIYTYITYDSEVEREFARQLDQREDIKLFVKLPAWFKVETPLGGYNPDWAVVKEGDKTLYLVRETKGHAQFPPAPHHRSG